MLVYVYQEFVTGNKSGSSGEPSIEKLGPYATIHERHFLQQSAYTVCLVDDSCNVKLVSHENLKRHSFQQQDLIWKFNIPSKERIKVLKSLNKMNINAYSLFLTVDSLMEATAVLENRF